MIIKIESFEPISHKERAKVVANYLELYEKVVISPTDEILENNYKIELNESHAARIRTTREYNVVCRKTKTQLIFKIWFA